MAKLQKNRQPKFADYQTMLQDAEALLERGYNRHGNWSLGQATSHVADWMVYPIDGFPVPPLPIRMIFWVMKKTIAPGMKRKILAEGFKDGTPTAPASVVEEGAMSDANGVAKLRSAIERVQTAYATNLELIPSPLFGPMDHATHEKVTLLHAEHHFAYLEPK